LNVNSHHYGFGNLNLNELDQVATELSATTKQKPSNKFRMQLELK